ncbi:MAG: patatin-like phospholipase family protein [Bacteroidales bacterium]|nr:patatin-like phospholipase family protein [Bacteroidales bacterium]MDD3162412.1 patatin-like phospholipase family protein [Bacteroidales bacterium]
MEAFKKKRYNLGLVLSGGGAKGFAHAGAIQSLEEHGLQPDIIAGTSAGAIVAALYAAGHTPHKIYEMFQHKEFNMFAEFTMPIAGFFNPTRFMDFLHAQLGVDTFEELAIPVYAIATDLDHGKSVVFNSGELTPRLMASCCVPVVFAPIVIDDIHYVDGGIFRNFPVSAIRPLCDTIIGVNASPMVPKKYKQSMLQIAERTYHYMFRANTVTERKQCDILVEMKEALQYGTFDLKNVDTIFRMGYEEMNKRLDQTNLNAFLDKQ